MSKIPYAKLPRALTPSKALTALLGAAAVQYLVIVSDFEGYVPLGYRDPVSIPTKCFGDTTNVVVGKKYSFAECERSLNEHSVEIVRPIRKCIKDFDKLPDKTKAALASMSYNIGSGAMCKSSIVQYANAGNYTRMCSRMREIYLYATDRKSGKKFELPGLKKRRNREADLCEEGLKEWKDEQNQSNTKISADDTGVSPRSPQSSVDAKDTVVHQATAPDSFLDRLRRILASIF